MNRFLVVSGSLALVFLCSDRSQAQGQCQPGWSQGFDVPGFNGPIRALIRFNDGSGPSLYAGGSFSRIDGMPAPGIARWNGSTWSVPGNELSGLEVHSFAIFDDGAGPALYAAGYLNFGASSYAYHVVRWDGTSWTPVGPGVITPGSFPTALCVFDDGSGPALFAATRGQTILSPLNNVWKWDGSNWNALGSGASNWVLALAVYDDGSGPALYAGGSFTTFDGVTARGIARWDGAAWSEGTGGAGIVGSVYTLFPWNDGNSSALYVGGFISHAGGVPVQHVARWDGTSWSAVGTGITGAVSELFAHDLGEGPTLYASAGQAPFAFRLEGTTWSPLGPGTDSSIGAFAAFGSGSGVSIFAGGSFRTAGGVAAAGFASWDGSSWHAYPTTMNGSNGDLRVLRTLDTGSGPNLYAGGDFTVLGNAAANRVGRWNGIAWEALGSGTDGTVRAFARFNDGTGPKVYAGGDFTQAGGAAASRVARWNGTSWSALSLGTNGPVHALVASDVGGGPALYAGGLFTFASGTGANRVARWNGSSWSGVGGGTNNNVYAIVEFDDGSGPAIYAAGVFTAAGGTSANRIARWNGTSWSSLGSGVGGSVFALLVFDDGSGPALYAAGDFDTAGGVTADNIAKWDGSTWSPLGVGINARIFGLAELDDGSGRALYAAGIPNFPDPNRVYRWNGSSWSILPGWVYTAGSEDPEVFALESFDDGLSGGPDLFVGGRFTTVGAIGPGTYSSNVARWDGCAGPGSPYCLGDGVAASCPCVNSGAPGRGCQNSFSTGGARLTASGTTAPDTVVLGATAELPQALSIFLQGNATLGPLVFGDGLRCAGGALKRLYTKNASVGAVSAPGLADPSITTRSAALGDPIASGTPRFYQTYYRDPNAAFCPNPPGNSFNVTNGVRIDW